MFKPLRYNLVVYVQMTLLIAQARTLQQLPCDRMCTPRTRLTRDTISGRWEKSLALRIKYTLENVLHKAEGMDGPYTIYTMQGGQRRPPKAIAYLRQQHSPSYAIAIQHSRSMRP